MTDAPKPASPKTGLFDWPLSILALLWLALKWKDPA